MPGDDDAPISSYSDPIYDRLDVMARQVKRLWWLFALGLLVVVVASIMVRMYARREPTAVGVALALSASKEEGEKREESWKTLADGTGNDPGFRAVACIELAQLRLNAGDPAKARERALQAEDFAKQIKDEDLRLAAMLSQAAIAAESNDYAAALEIYGKCSGFAGAKYQARRLTADLGAARCLEKLGRIDEAIQRLEPLTTRTDVGAAQLIDLAIGSYWRLKRQQATPKPAVDAKPEAPKAEAPKPAVDAKPEAPKAEAPKPEAPKAAEPAKH